MFFIAPAVLFISSAMAQSQSDDEPSYDDAYARSERVMANTMNQFVYAFFGKELLLNYLVEADDISAIRSVNDSDLLQLSKPFNTTTSKFVMAGMVSIYWATLAYFILRVLAFAFESSWLLQRKGVLPMDNDTFKSFSIKFVVLSAMAVAPMTVSFNGNEQKISLYNLFLFDLMGRAHQMGDDSLSSMVSDQRMSMQTVRMPHADAKWSSGLAVNDFMTCVRLDHSRQSPGEKSQAVSFHIVENNKVEATLSEGRCHLKMQFGYDSQTPNLIKKLESSNKNLPISSSTFINAQREIFSAVASEALRDAFKNSEVLSMPIYQQGLNSTENKSVQFSTALWTSDSLSDHELERWEGQCDALSAWNIPVSALSDTDRRVYQLMTARCISGEITKSLLYPDTFGDVTKFLQNETLKNRHLPLCVDEVEYNQGVSGSRYVPRFTLGMESDPVSESQLKNIEHFSLDSCLSKFCSESSLRSGGLYSCVNSLDMYQQRKSDLDMEARGVLMLGFYMFNLYSQQVPTERAKHIYQSTEFTFSSSAFTKGAQSGDAPFFQLNVQIPALREDHDFRVDDVQKTLETPFAQPEFLLVEPIDPKELSTTAMNAIQHSRLLTCARNPLQVTDGYVCGNLPREFSAFGMNVLRFAVAAKSMLILGDLMRNSGSVPKEQGTISAGPIKRGVGSLLMMVAAGGIGYSIIDGVMEAGFASTDEFGYLDQKSVRQFTYYQSGQMTALTLAILGSNEISQTLLDAIEWALVLLLIIGVLCAFVIPLMPMLLVMYALVKFSFKLFMTIFMTGINLINAVFEEDASFLTESVDKIWADWLALILKLPLLFIGVILAWLMSNVIIAHVLQKMQISFVTNDGSMGPIDTLVMLVMIFGIIFVVYNTVMTVIESFYDFTVEWILGQMSNSPFSDRRAMGWKDSKDVLALMGR